MSQMRDHRGVRWSAGFCVLGLAMSLAGLAITGCDRSPDEAATQQKEPASSGETGSETRSELGVVSPNPNEQINQRFVETISARIEGREDLPSEEVFSNVQLLKGVPAGRFLRIMSRGYSQALGTNCTHCHVENDFSSDELRPKRAAREMAVMHRTILAELRRMESLETPSEQRAINCDTCHRGGLDPMREME